MTAQSIPTPSPLNLPLLSKAYTSLQSHLSTLATSKTASSAKTALITPTSEPLYMCITLTKVPAKGSAKPIRIDVPFNVNGSSEEEEEDLSVCIIVKDALAKSTVEDTIESSKSLTKFVTKVISLDMLRKNHDRYEQKRELLKSHTHFLADDRILPMLAKALGKSFFESKKQPFAIKINASDTDAKKESLKQRITKSIKSTYFTIPTGISLTVKVGLTSFTASELQANSTCVLDKVCSKISGGFSGVRGVGVKSGGSTMLPVYVKDFKEMKGLEEVAGVAAPTAAAAIVGGKKGKKRAVDETEAAPAPVLEEEKVKSKLLKAVKKVKEVETEVKKSLEEVKEKKVKKTIEMAVEEFNEKEEKEGKGKDKKGEKKRKAGVDTPVKEAAEVVAEVVVKSSKKSRRDDVAKSATPSKSEAKAEASPMAPLEKPTFAAATKFVGVKKGMVFKLGRQGLGYYVDKVPVVDQMMIEGLRDRGRKSPNAGKGKGKSTFNKRR